MESFNSQYYNLLASYPNIKMCTETEILKETMTIVRAIRNGDKHV